MYHWVNSKGMTIKTKSIKEFSDLTGIRYSNARSLASGHYLSLHGYSAVHPKTRKKRKRMLLELVNTRTHERVRLGGNVARFSAERGICKSELHKLCCGRKIAIRDWTLASTADLLAQAPVAETTAQNHCRRIPVPSHYPSPELVYGIDTRSAGDHQRAERDCENL